MEGSQLAGKNEDSPTGSIKIVKSSNMHYYVSRSGEHWEHITLNIRVFHVCEHCDLGH